MRQPVLLNADLTENRRISPVAMTLTLNRVPLSTASIQLTEDETIPARAWVELFTPKGSAGIFRAREPDNTYGDRIATVELEHAIAEVGNSIVAEKLEEEMPLNNAMARLFGHYKGSVWQMATIPFTDTVTVDVDYENVLESINRLIKQTPYMIVFDFSTTPWTFGLAQTDESVTAEGRLSRNVMTGSIKYDDSNMATRAYAAYDNGEGQEALVYEDDAAAIAQYGLIEKKLNEVYANETKARAAAVKYLQAYNRPKVSSSINGEELVHITGESLDSFEPGKRMRFVFDADETPIDEIIDSVRYNDLVAEEDDVTVSMAEEDDYEYVLNELKESNRRNRSRINRINDEIHRDLWSSDGRLHSQLDLTASHLRTYFEDTAEGYWSEIEQTAEHWRSVYADAQNNLGIVEQTASYWRSVYADAQNNLGQIEQTASYWRSTYADAQNNLGQIEQTASYWRSSYESIGGLLGQIEQTASYWRNTYSDTANGLRAEVQQTANYWRSQLVDEGANQRSSIEQTAASLTFTADQIYLDGDTKISDILGINSSGFLTVDGDIYQTGTIYPGGVTIGRGGDLKMWTGGSTGDPGSQVSLSGMDVNDMIVKADVSGNTLTLWKRGADLSASSGNRIINFSKATSLSGLWSGRNYTVTAKQNNVSVGTKTGIVYDGLVPTGDVTQSGKTVYRDFIVYSDDGEGEADQIIMQKNIGITVPYEDTYWMVNNINRTAPDGFTKVTSNGQVYYTADNTSGANKGLRVYMAPKITVDGIEFNTDSVHQVYFAALPTQIWHDAYEAGASSATVEVTAGTSAITWDSTNKKFYNYGYAYVNGGSQPEATSTKRESSVVSLDTSASWSNGSKSIVAKHGSTNILSDSVSIPASSGTAWENPTGHQWRARLTIGGAYRYSDNHEFYTLSEYNAALATVPSGYTAKDSTTITNGNINAASIGVYSGHYACNMSLTLNFGDGTTRSADVSGGVIVDDIVNYGKSLGGGESHTTSYSMYCSEGGQVPGTSTYRYRFTIEFSSPRNFSAGSSYTFWR